MNQLHTKILLIGVVLAIAIFGYRVFLAPAHNHNDHDHEKEEEILDQLSDDHVHLHAGVRVFVDGVEQNYDGDEWMHVTPCTIDDYKALELTDPYDKIHWHDNIGTVVHVHAKGTVWREMFESAKLFDLVERDDVVTYRSGEVADDVMEGEVEQFETVIFVFGNAPEGIDFTNIDEYVSKEQILIAENSSESCGS